MYWKSILKVSIVVIVNVLNHIQGRYRGMRFRGRMSVQRPCLLIDRKWKVIAAVVVRELSLYYLLLFGFETKMYFLQVLP